jgi:hypothetical protein
MPGVKMLSCSKTSSECIEFFVSETGDDNAPGTKERPFNTLQCARNAIREIKKSCNLKVPVNVIMRGGTYFLAEPLKLNKDDSGTQNCQISYIAYPGEQPVISGGTKITGWKPYKNKIMQCFLPEVKEGKWSFRQLFCNGIPQPISCYPKIDHNEPVHKGWAFIESADPEKDPFSFYYGKNNFTRKWLKPHQGEINVFPWVCWSNDIIPIKKIDEISGKIELTRPPISYSGAQKHEFALMTGNRFRIENMLEDINSPGEWCLDKETGVLYFWPTVDSLESAEIIAPRLGSLIEIKGTQDQAVEYINFSGIKFTHTLTKFPLITPKAYDYPKSDGAAIDLEYANHCKIEQCTIDNVGANAIRFKKSNVCNNIANNVFSNLGSHGICVIGINERQVDWAGWDTPELLCAQSKEMPYFGNNVIQNNHIHHCGEIDKRGTGVCIYSINTIDNHIVHNHIHHTSQQGMLLQHGFGRNFIEFNKIHDIALETCDTAGIMMVAWLALEGDEHLGQGNVIRFNFIHNVIGCGAYGKPRIMTSQMSENNKIWSPYYSWGIYLDYNTMKTIIYGNVVAENTLGGIMMLHNTKDNVIENNIFINGSSTQLYYDSVGNKARDNKFIRNIVLYSNAGANLIHLGEMKITPEMIESDYNIYWAGPDTNLSAEESYLKWKSMGHDKHSIIADPKFMDLKRYDLSLDPESPALKLGFIPIDMKQMGIVSDLAKQQEPSHICS